MISSQVHVSAAVVQLTLCTINAIVMVFLQEQVCSRLPIVSIACERPRADDRLESSDDTDGIAYSIKVRLQRVRGAHGAVLPRVYAPKFPKVYSLLKP